MRLVLVHHVRELSAGLAPLEEHRASLVVAREQTYGSGAPPVRERGCLVRRLAAGEADLEHCGRAVGALDSERQADLAAVVRLAQLQLPGLRTLADDDGELSEPLAAAGHPPPVAERARNPRLRERFRPGPISSLDQQRVAACHGF